MSVFFKNDSRNRKRHRGRRTRSLGTRLLQFESLEKRLLLANIAVTDAYLVAGGGTSALATPIVGQEIAVRVEWDTSDLPSNISNYQVEFLVDGVALRSASINSGAGAINASFWWYQLGWYASPGSHTVEVTVDVDNVIVEDDETDNSFSFNFTPSTASFPQLMIWPLETAPQTESFWTNYNDVDPTSGIQDYNGESASYNGHNAIDAGPVVQQEQDEGVEIYAALDGVVSAINDGEFDRQTTFNSDPANYVILDHGSGWETWYWHMRRDSVQVEVGQSVLQGERMGLVGSSGSSTGAHIHFEMRYHGLPVETHYDPATFWATPSDYVGDNPYLIRAGITNYNPNPHFWEGPSDTQTFSQSSGHVAYARGYFSGLRQNDVLELTWKRPSGSTYTTQNFTIPQDYSSSGWFFSVNLPATPDLGVWDVEYRVDGALLGTADFEVTVNGAPEIRVEETNGRIVVDGRFTPFDFGIENVGSAGTSMSYVVHNHGFEDLNLSGIELPDGFNLTNGLPGSIAPGASDTITIQLNTATAGNFAGEVRIFSDDAYESVFNFGVEGRVTTPAADHLVIGIGEYEVVEGNSMVANVRRTGSLSSSVLVSLSASDASEIGLPATVTIPAGEDYVQFFFDATDDFVSDGTQRVTIFASAASGYYPAQDDVDVLDGPTTGMVVGETGQASPVDANWFTVNFDNSFSNPVVVAGPLSFNGADPATVRIRNITSTGFEARILEWDYLNQVHGAEDFSYLVIEAGTHTLADGTILRAGNEVGVDHNWETVNFGGSFASTPVVLTQTVSENGAAAVVTRHDNISVSSFDVFLQEEQGANQVHAPETVSWVAIDQVVGSGFEAALTPDSVTDANYTISFNQTFSVTPTFIAAVQSFDGADPTGLRRTALNANSAMVFLEEEKSADAETGHTTEVVGYLAFEPGAILAQPSEYDQLGESGILTLTDAWTTVNLSKTYVDPVVIIGAGSNNGAEPMTFRVRNVTSNSFEVQIDEWDYQNATHGAENVGFVVMESGTHTLADGTLIRAGNNTVDHNLTTISLGSDFSTVPVVFSQTTTVNGQSAVTTRHTNVSASSFEVMLQEEQAGNQIHANENVSWLAIEVAVGSSDGLLYESNATAAAVTHANFGIGFSQTYSSQPVMLATMQTLNGVDPGVIRYTSLTGTGTSVYVDEETSADSETNHNAAESVGYFVLDAGAIVGNTIGSRSGDFVFDHVKELPNYFFDSHREVHRLIRETEDANSDRSFAEPGWLEEFELAGAVNLIQDVVEAGRDEVENGDVLVEPLVKLQTEV